MKPRLKSFTSNGQFEVNLEVAPLVAWSRPHQSSCKLRDSLRLAASWPLKRALSGGIHGLKLDILAHWCSPPAPSSGWDPPLPGNFRRLVHGYIDAEFCDRITSGKRNEKGDRRIALDEFYQIDTLWHLSGLKISLASSTSKKTKKVVMVDF